MFCSQIKLNFDRIQCLTKWEYICFPPVVPWCFGKSTSPQVAEAPGGAARSGWDVSGSKARWINFKCPYLPIAAQLYPLYFQDSLGCCSSSALFFQYSHFNLTWAANKIPFPICVVGGAECASGHAASKDRVHSHVGHSLISATLLCCSSPLKGSEQTTFCRSAWMAPKPRS